MSSRAKRLLEAVGVKAPFTTQAVKLQPTYSRLLPPPIKRGETKGKDKIDVKRISRPDAAKKKNKTREVAVATRQNVTGTSEIPGLENEDPDHLYYGIKEVSPKMRDSSAEIEPSSSSNLQTEGLCITPVDENVAGGETLPFLDISNLAHDLNIDATEEAIFSTDTASFKHIEGTATAATTPSIGVPVRLPPIGNKDPGCCNVTPNLSVPKISSKDSSPEIEPFSSSNLQAEGLFITPVDENVAGAENLPFLGVSNLAHDLNINATEEAVFSTDTASFKHIERTATAATTPSIGIPVTLPPIGNKDPGCCNVTPNLSVPKISSKGSNARKELFPLNINLDNVDLSVETLIMPLEGPIANEDVLVVQYVASTINDEFDLGLQEIEVSADEPPVIFEVVANNSQKRKRQQNGPVENVKKRGLNPTRWKQAELKKAVNSGKAYINSSGKSVPARSLKEACSSKCSNHCGVLVSEELRQNIFKKYWGLERRDLQWFMLGKLFKPKPIERRRAVVIEDVDPYRKNNYDYYLPDLNGSLIEVCQKMFLSTFDISITTVKTALGKNSPDKRGKHNNRRRLSDALVQSVKDHIKSFPVVDSHYCRLDSRKKYLDEHLTVAAMHRFYLAGREVPQVNPDESGSQEEVGPDNAEPDEHVFHPDNNNNQAAPGPSESPADKDNSKNEPEVKVYLPDTANVRQYRDIFNKSFNLGFFKPKKDQCSLCVKWKTMSEAEKTQTKLNEYNAHISANEQVRTLRREDKILSRDKEKGKGIKVVTFDLQKVLYCPKSEVGEFFYKRKLSVYDFTVYDCTLKKAVCHVWDQTLAKRGSDEMGSFIRLFIEMEVKNGINDFRFYSDSCSGQNKNQFLYSLYYWAAMKFNIKITHRYLVVGHTQMECDSVHARIEKKTKKEVIFTPNQWYEHMKQAKVQQPSYAVHEASQQEIFSLKDMASFMVWSKVPISSLREVVLDSAFPEKAFYRKDFDSVPTEIDIIKKKKGRPVNWLTYKPQLAYEKKIPLKPKLVPDLKWFLTKNLVPTQFIPYYTELVSEPAEEDDDEDDIPFEVDQNIAYEDAEGDDQLVEEEEENDENNNVLDCDTDNSDAFD